SRSSDRKGRCRTLAISLSFEPYTSARGEKVPTTYEVCQDASCNEKDCLAPLKTERPWPRTRIGVHSKNPIHLLSTTWQSSLCERKWQLRNRHSQKKTCEGQRQYSRIRFSG